MHDTSHEPNGTIYRYTADLKYVLNGTVYDIDTPSIKTMAIDRDYIN